MKREINIALDAMGGDHGPGVVIPAAALALERRPDTRYLLFGDEKLLQPLLAAQPKLAARATIIHCDVAVKMTDKPSQALRQGRRVSSMWRAIEAVKKGEADCTVSAGNTGALMAMAKICLHMLPMIERPALAAMWPTMRGESIVLDVGASIGADAQHLVDLAVMGAALARIVFDIETPTVGLLNVGVEEIKGLEEVKAAGRMLREGAWPRLQLPRFRRGRRSRPRHRRCVRDRGIHRQYRAEDGRRHRPADRPIPARGDGGDARHADRLSAGARRLSRRSGASSIPAAPTAPSSLALTA